jgi:hypothetical protein
MGSGILLKLGFEIPGDIAPPAQVVKKPSATSARFS